MANWFNQQYNIPPMNYPQFNNTNRYPTPQNNGIVWVQGEEGTKAYQLPPNTNVILMDSEIDGRFYIKTTDNIGMANLRYFSFTEIVQDEKPKAEYVTKEDLAKAIKELKDEQSIQRTEQQKPKFNK